MGKATTGPSVLALDDAPVHLVRLAQQRHTRMWSDEFGGDLTGPQYAVVSAVGPRGELDQRTIGERASLDKSSTADVVARLSSQGWLQFGRDPADARRKRVRLTALGRTALPEVSRRARLVQDRLLEPVPAEVAPAFLAAMRIVGYAGAVPDPDHRTDARVLTLRDTPGHLIRRSQQVHTVLWAEEVGSGVGSAAGPALTAPQYALLSVIAGCAGDLDQTAAGRLAGLDKSSTADVVARLVRHGWMTRRRDVRDARCHLLGLTDAVHDELPALTAAVRRVQERLLAPLPDGDRGSWLAGYRVLAGAEPTAC